MVLLLAIQMINDTFGFYLFAAGTLDAQRFAEIFEFNVLKVE